jgi:hypothetical protein
MSDSEAVEDAPTWLAAIGTVGAFATGFWQIASERRRRIADEEERRIERRREQARLISAYMGEEEGPRNGSADEPSDRDGQTSFYLANNSTEPVYSLVVGLVFIQGAAPHTMEEMLRLNQEQFHRQGPVTTVSILPGGLYRVKIAGTGWHRIMSGRAGVEIAFTDRAGASWIRRASGTLEELRKPTLDYFRDFHLAGPYEFQTPERVPLGD